MIFFVVTSMDYVQDGDGIAAFTWFEDHTMYQAAEEYAEEHGAGRPPSDFFPNRLIWERLSDEDQFSETEKKYIQEMVYFIDTFSRNNIEEYHLLRDELKADLHIKNSYNPFD